MDYPGHFRVKVNNPIRGFQPVGILRDLRAGGDAIVDGNGAGVGGHNRHLYLLVVGLPAQAAQQGAQQSRPCPFNDDILQNRRRAFYIRDGNGNRRLIPSMIVAYERLAGVFIEGIGLIPSIPFM